MRIRRIFQDKANRDAAFREMNANGYAGRIRKSTIRNQNLDPNYVEDSEGGPTGLASDYQRFWTVLYKIEESW